MTLSGLITEEEFRAALKSAKSAAHVQALMDLFRPLPDAPEAPRWTTTTPTESGYYWAIPRNRPPSTPLPVYVDIGPGFSSVDTIGTELDSRLGAFSHWIRIEVPEAPK